MQAATLLYARISYTIKGRAPTFTMLRLACHVMTLLPLLLLLLLLIIIIITNIMLLLLLPLL